jgi:hypothetical protein
MIAPLLTWLRNHPFSFLPAQSDALVAALALVPDSARLSRRSFKRPPGSESAELILSVYAEGSQVDRIDLTLWAHAPGETKQAYRRSLAELSERYQRALHLVQQLEGAPLFEGKDGDEGFPEDLSAVRLACWKKPWGRLVRAQHATAASFR